MKLFHSTSSFGLAVAASLAFMAASAEAQAPTAGSDCLAWASGNPFRTSACNDVARFLQSDDAVPESPAFAMLGVSSENVVRPTSPNQLGLSVLNGVDPHGNFQSGIAIETAPFMLLAGDDITLKDYQTDNLTRFLANTQVSLATTAGQEDNDESRRLAIGFHLTPWDKGDPRLDSDTVECFNKALSTAISQLPAVPPPGTPARANYKASGDELTKARESAKTGAAKCRADAKKRLANASAWTFGATPSFFSSSGDLDDMDFTGVAVWTSVALNPRDFPDSTLGKNAIGKNMGAALLHLRYMYGEQVAVDGGNGTFYDRNSLIAGLGWRFGSPTFVFGLEGSFINAENENRADDQFYQFGAKVEYQLPETNLWLKGNVSTTSGEDGGNNSGFRFSLNWAFNDDGTGGK